MSSEQWIEGLPSLHGWYFMRREGETPVAEGLVVWVGYNKSGVRYEGKFFYAGQAFLDQREFFGPLIPDYSRREATWQAVADALKGLAIDLYERDGSGLCWCPLNHLTELLTFEETGEHSDQCKTARAALAAVANGKGGEDGK